MFNKMRRKYSFFAIVSVILLGFFLWRESKSTKAPLLNQVEFALLNHDDEERVLKSNSNRELRVSNGRMLASAVAVDSLLFQLQSIQSRDEALASLFERMPELYEVLLHSKDVFFLGPEILYAIQEFGPSEESSECLIEFVRRDESDRISKLGPGADSLFKIKYKAAGTLGYTGGEAANTFLRSLLDLDGATDASRLWLDDVEDGPFERTPRMYVQLLRGWAAKGIAISQNAENLSHLELWYETNLAEFKNMHGPLLAPGERQRHMTHTEALVYKFHGFLAEAMAINATIKEMGRDAYIERTRDPDLYGYMALLQHHHEKYSFPLQRYQLKQD